MPGRRHCCALLVILCSGCTPEPAPPPIDWEGEHLNFGAEEPERVCGGTREYLDHRLGRLREHFGPQSAKVNYYFVGDALDYCVTNKDRDPVGCNAGNDIYAEWPQIEHELVHAARPGYLPLALEEGLATYWGTPWPSLAAEDLVARDQVRPLIETGSIDTLEEYGRMAHFVTFLAERSGTQSLIELDAAVGLHSSTAALDEALSSVMGASLEELLEEYEDFPDCNGYVSVELACEGPAIELGEVQKDLTRTIDCGDEEALGPAYGKVFVEEVIEILPGFAGPRLIQVSGDGIDAGGSVVIRPCGPCGDGGVGLISVSGVLDPEQLPWGRYVVRLQVPEEAAPATITFTIGS